MGITLLTTESRTNKQLLCSISGGSSCIMDQFSCVACRVLVFTQMARMLDILEIFLNYHGHTYLRLDGATPILERQASVYCTL